MSDDKRLITVKDVGGVYRTIYDMDLYQALTDSNFTLFGMDINTILRLRYWYMMRGGCDPMTERSVDKVFK